MASFFANLRLRLKSFCVHLAIWTIVPATSQAAEWTSRKQVDDIQLTYWNADACKRDKFPQLYDPLAVQRQMAQFGNDRRALPGILRAISVMHMFCGRRWNSAAIEALSTKIRRARLRVEDWGHPMHAGLAAEMERNFRQIDPLLPAFIDVATAASIIKLAKDKTRFTSFLSSLSKIYPNPPQSAEASSLISEIDLEMVVTQSNHPPIEILLNQSAPAIRLYTDSGVEMSLRDLADTQFMNFNGSAGDSVFATYFGGGKADVDSFTTDLIPVINPIQAQYTSFLNMYTAVLLGQREKYRLANPERYPALSDLDILWYSKAKRPSCGGQVIHNSGFYCPGKSIIFVNQTAPKKKLPITKTAQAFADFNSDLFHELAHYTQWTKGVSDFPFLLEGDATAAGEIVLRSIVAAREAASRHPEKTQKSRQLFESTIANPTKEQIEAYKSMVATLIKETSLTERSKRYVCLIQKQGISAHDIERHLSQTPLLFREQPNVEYAYARGWLLYTMAQSEIDGGAQYVKFPDRLASIATRMASRNTSNAITLRQELADISKLAESWSRAVSKRYGLNCGVLLQ